MGNSKNFDILRHIDYYFTHDAASDLNVSEDSFTQFCVSRIWITTCNRQALFSRFNPSTGKRAEDLFEVLKELTGSDVLPIEEISLNPITLRLKLKNGVWYIYKWTGFYYVIPEWTGAREVPRYMDIDEDAKLMLSFDRYIPKIQSRAQEFVLKYKEKQTACEIIKASAEGLIRSLQSEGTISLQGEADVSCPDPGRIEVTHETTKWLVKSLDELKALLLRRFGAK